MPAELREAQSRAGAEAFPVWVEARANNDFELFRPYLERNIALRREYASCFEVDEPYDALLDDFEPGMKTQEVRDVFTRLREGLVPLVAELSAQEIDDSCLFGDFPVEANSGRCSSSCSTGSGSARAAGASTRWRIRSPPRSGRRTSG